MTQQGARNNMSSIARAPPDLDLRTSLPEEPPQIQSQLSGQESGFTLFSSLPHEIRQKIWRYSIRCQRIIQVHLEVNNGDLNPSDAISNGFTIRYNTVVTGYQAISKFFRVSSESRVAALRFYRVHLPCRFTAGARNVFRDGTTHPNPKPCIFHFNPEFDFLEITSTMVGTVGSSQFLPHFLFKVKTTYDPRQVGVLNMAVGLNDNRAYNCTLLPPTTAAPVLFNAYTETITSLREVLFVCSESAGRQILGWQSDFLTSKILYDRSLPVHTLASTFEEQLTRDPRRTAQDSRRSFAGTFDPRDNIISWRKMLGKWGIPPTHIKYSFAISSDEERDESYQHPDQFIRQMERLEKIETVRERCTDEGPHTTLKPGTKFWLFPIEALGDVSRNETYGTGARFSFPRRVLTGLAVA